jgi:anthranilate/para-aminobenzoate synthase component I
MEIIDELEPHARGVYTGAIGFFGSNGVSHFNIAIRTAVYVGQASRLSTGENWTGGTPVLPAGGRLTFHAGGGIVADSEPEAEYAETLDKAEGIIRGLNQLRLR